MNNTKLIAALEEATGPDRELDAEIALAVGYTTYPDSYGDGDEWVDPQGNHLQRATRMGAQPPKFSASIDAALTLVPEGWCYRIEKTMHGTAVHIGKDHPLCGDEVEAPTPAFAICIAALRAQGADKP